jgi:restriction endonuclease
MPKRDNEIGGESAKARLRIELSEEQLLMLDELQKLSGIETRGEVIRNALRLFEVAILSKDQRLRVEPRISPVTESIIVVNRRLIDYFGKEPEKLRTVDPFLFERIVAELFEQEGYEIVQTPPRTDGGKDIYVFKTDQFTRTMYLVECKRYVPPNTVGVDVVRHLYGVVQQERASGGIIVTTSYFTQPAKDFANIVPYHLFLKDFDELSRWFKKLRG